MPLNSDVEAIIRSEFKTISKNRYKVLDNIELDNIDLNPYLLKVLALETPKEIADFIISQRVERSLVTSYGSRIQKIAKQLSERGTGVEGADICKERDGRRYYIQVKAGPNTVNKDISNQISTLLQSAVRRNSGSVALVGMTYGKRERVSSILQRYSQVNWIIGREFWEFISENPNCAHEIFLIASETTQEVPDGGLPYRERYREKVRLLAEQIREKYGEDDDMWNRLFEDNM